MTDIASIETLLAAASAAHAPFAALRPAVRAGLLRRMALALDSAAADLIPIAQQETKLPEARLKGELSRTTFQLRLFADVLLDGAYLEATIDSADPKWPPAPRPDLRRMLLPVGPVVVFAASNFPFAFSVAGGDTASALAAGCPVVLKAHPGHPRLGDRTADVVRAALREGGAPEGTFAIFHGDEAGRAALLDPRIKAGAFTGSTHGGRALFDLASSRPVPIPFYAEMGSVNPVFVTESAARARGAEYLDSYTLGAGQFCTKPGFLFVPESAAEEIELRLVAGILDRAAAPLLNERIATGYSSVLGKLRAHPAIRMIHAGQETGSGPGPTLLGTTAKSLVAQRDELLVECFGPTSVVVRYAGEDELIASARIFAGELTASIHGESGDAIAPQLFAELSERAGRVLWNGWPTGVAVSHAMHHGGPYPSTTSALHTSVGPTSIRRFLRPVCYQSVPQNLLPEALQDANPLDIPRAVDGKPPRR